MASRLAPRSSKANIESWCITQSELVSIVFKWSIRNFCFHMGKPGCSIKSAIFPSEVVHGTRWRLIVYPNGNNMDSKDYVSVYLELIPDNADIDATVRFCCSILDNKNEEKHTSKLPSPHKFEKSSLTWGWLKYVERQVLTNNAQEFLPNDSLHIHFEISLLLELPVTSGTSPAPKIPECRLGDDFSGLFEKALFSDVTLTTNGEKFKVHKSVLAARSTVFDAMFTSEMKEKHQDVIEIKDMDKDVMYNMLRFIYTGKVVTDASLKMMSDLLVASDKYNLERLKIICESVLCPQINADNVSDLLVLAYLHCASQLKTTAMEFVNNNISAVMKSENWISLMQSHPQLVNEVLEYHLQAYHKKNIN